MQSIIKSKRSSFGCQLSMSSFHKFLVISFQAGCSKKVCFSEKTDRTISNILMLRKNRRADPLRKASGPRSSSNREVPKRICFIHPWPVASYINCVEVSMKRLSLNTVYRPQIFPERMWSISKLHNGESRLYLFLSESWRLMCDRLSMLLQLMLRSRQLEAFCRNPVPQRRYRHYIG